MLEIELTIRLDADGDFIPEGSNTPIFVEGTLDLVVPPNPQDWNHDGKIIVEDIKTGRIKQRDLFEVKLYLWMAIQWARAQGHDVRSAQFSYHYARFNERDSLFFAELQLPELWPWILDQIEQHRKIQLIPIPGHHCQWCQFMGAECPLGIGLDDHIIPTDPPELIGLGDRLDRFLTTGEMAPSDTPMIGFAVAWMDAKTQVAKANLKKWILNNSPVRIGDTEWIVSSDDNSVCDQQLAYEILSAHKIAEPWKVAEINKTRLKRISKTHPEAYAAVMGVAFTNRPPKRVLRQRELTNE